MVDTHVSETLVPRLPDMDQAMFFPYDARLLRCHPGGFGYQGDRDVFLVLRCTDLWSLYKWKCTECESIYTTSDNFFSSIEK